MIQPGLERIALLLKGIDLSWKSIHVAGTNGKGSVCHTVNTLLQRRCHKTGLFFSPHIIDRWDCIQLNSKPVEEALFKKVEQHFLQLNERGHIKASEFEILTATAFQIFNDSKVEFGVVEVGMGGKLDATNILNNQLVSVITKISRDHEKFLGSTLEDIAIHKAGILRSNVPYVVDSTNEPNVQHVIDRVANEVGAGPRLLGETDELREDIYKNVVWRKAMGTKLPWQRENAILGIVAAKEALRSQGESASRLRKLIPALKNNIFPGRVQNISMQPVLPKNILVDGAHNEDAAKALADYVKQRIRRPDHGKARYTLRRQLQKEDQPVTWIIAMSAGRDPRGFLEKLVQPQDAVVATTFEPVDGMPWVTPIDPVEISAAAERIGCKRVVTIPDSGAYRAMFAAKHLTNDPAPIVMTGSLYLMGQFLREKRAYKEDKTTIDIPTMNRQERNRVNRIYFSKLDTAKSARQAEQGLEPIGLDKEKRQLRSEPSGFDKPFKRRLVRANTMNENDLRRSSRNQASLVPPIDPDVVGQAQIKPRKMYAGRLRGFRKEI